jgi:hypothetical protein
VELQGFRVIDVRKVDDGLEEELAPDGRYRPRCGSCGDIAPYRDMRYPRRFRHGALVGNCGASDLHTTPRQLPKLWVTWQQVAALFHCSWNTVAEAVDDAVEYGLAKRDISDLAYIGIDEISRKRGHAYLANVYDLEAGNRNAGFYLHGFRLL